jgi:hypothetical protein
MVSKPITQRAGTKYGSAPANQEVTVDARGTTPAKFERMSPVKQTTDPPKSDPPESVEEDVRDESSNDLLRGRATFSIGPDQVIVKPGETKYGWNGPLDTSGQYYENLAKEEGFKNFPGTIKQYEESKLKKMAKTGDANVTQQQGESTTTTVPGSRLAKFDYKPEIQNIDTEKLRESRQTSRIVKGSGRRATAASNQVDRLDERLEKIKDKNPGLSQKDLEKLPNYSRIQRKLDNKTKAAEALQSRFNQNVELVKSGVNPYNTRRSEQSKKATGSEPTKEEFESRFGGDNLGVHQIKSTTADSIKFYTPTIPTSTNTGANFVGAGSYLTQMANDDPKAVGQKRGYKMGGYGAKNK